MKHLVLLGDSIFDNKAYVGSEPDVISSLRSILPRNWRATLKAIDGSLVENVGTQTFQSPADATHFFISVGGNNAILNSDVLQMSVSHSAEVFNELADRIGTFESNYREMLKIVLSRQVPTTVCTIYYPNYPDELIQKVSVAALSAFNDVIIRQATLNGLPYLDLRLICNKNDDYANEIEPSSKGGRKIAEKILEVTQSHNFTDRKSIAYF